MPGEPNPNPVPHGDFFGAANLDTLKAKLARYADLIHSTLHSLTFDDNIRGVFVNVTFPVAPNTNQSIVHNLGFVPQGYLVVKRDTAAIIYDGSVAWTTTTLSLRSNAASTVVTLFVF